MRALLGLGCAVVLISGCDGGMTLGPEDGGRVVIDGGRANDAGMLPDDAGSDEDAGSVDAGPQPCVIDCDCPQGQVCAGDTCIAVADPVFCCEHAGCPQGERCVDTGGVVAA